MEITIDIPYEQLLKAISGLSKEHKQQIQHLLAKELAGEPAVKTETALQQLLLQAPTWNESAYRQYLSGRKHLNQLRKK